MWLYVPYWKIPVSRHPPIRAKSVVTSFLLFTSDFSFLKMCLSETMQGSIAHEIRSNGPNSRQGFYSGWPRLAGLARCDNARPHHAVRLSFSWAIRAQPRPNLYSTQQIHIYLPYENYLLILSDPVWIIRLVYNNDSEFSLMQFFDDIPRYAILSHTWGLQEVTFRDMIDRNRTSKTGFDKIRFYGEQARRDSL